jgi:hypothetical protein
MRMTDFIVHSVEQKHSAASRLIPLAMSQG